MYSKSCYQNFPSCHYIELCAESGLKLAETELAEPTFLHQFSLLIPFLFPQKITDFIDEVKKEHFE